ncbi:putative Rho-type GTPase-activating protein 2 [Smittium mucronatum]|uniref:Putative Rho-type GTPase-activating protein 2 n=1 Tax=Smittium mucronatum TaxID=133383 RepID=A0A1R0GMI6_9FUNG|nr:putative Rho-type GTPase-activating protein 2 [Smittium mucronatum]
MDSISNDVLTKVDIPNSELQFDILDYLDSDFLHSSKNTPSFPPSRTPPIQSTPTPTLTKPLSSHSSTSLPSSFCFPKPPPPPTKDVPFSPSFSEYIGFSNRSSLIASIPSSFNSNFSPIFKFSLTDFKTLRVKILKLTTSTLNKSITDPTFQIAVFKQPASKVDPSSNPKFSPDIPFLLLQKTYSQISKFNDDIISNSISSSTSSLLPPLPSLAKFDTIVPIKLIQLKSLVQKHLLRLISTPVSSNAILVNFFTSDFISAKPPNLSSLLGFKRGYLSYKEKPSSNWNRRYFICDISSATLNCYLYRNGPFSFSINLNRYSISSLFGLLKVGYTYLDDLTKMSLLNHSFKLQYSPSSKNPTFDSPDFKNSDHFVLWADSELERDEFVFCLNFIHLCHTSDSSIDLKSTVKSASKGLKVANLFEDFKSDSFDPNSKLHPFLSNKISSPDPNPHSTPSQNPSLPPLDLSFKNPVPINLIDSETSSNTSPNVNTPIMLAVPLSSLPGNKNSDPSSSLDNSQTNPSIPCINAPPDPIKKPNDSTSQESMSNPILLSAPEPNITSPPIHDILLNQPLSEGLYRDASGRILRVKEVDPVLPDDTPLVTNDVLGNGRNFKQQLNMKLENSGKPRPQSSWGKAFKMTAMKFSISKKKNLSSNASIISKDNSSHIDFECESNSSADSLINNLSKSQISHHKSNTDNYSKKLSPSSPMKMIPVFGAPIEVAVQLTIVRKNYLLPSVAYRCIEYLDHKKAYNDEGIYRLSGSSKAIEFLKQKFDYNRDYNLLQVSEGNFSNSDSTSSNGGKIYFDTHTVASLFKLYLRSLPQNILTPTLFPFFSSLISIQNRTSKLKLSGQLVLSLPLPNYTLLRSLLAHLIRIIKHSSVNLMTLRNIGIVFSPTLGIPVSLLCFLIIEFSLIFNVNDETGIPEPLSPSSDGNSLSVVTLNIDFSEFTPNSLLASKDPSKNT